MEEMSNANQPASAPSYQAPPQEVPMPQPAPSPSTPPPTSPVVNKNMIALLSYLGVLIIVPFLTAKDDPFVKFHIKQGLTLIILAAILYLGSFFLFFLSSIISYIAYLLILVLAILGIVNVVNGETKELPVIGGFASKFNF